MRKILITGLVLFMALLFVACGSIEKFLSEAATEDTVITKTQNMNSQKAKQDVMIPQEIEEIPDEYFKVSDQPGTLVELYYDTYESFSYEKKSKPLKKIVSSIVRNFPSGSHRTKLHYAWLRYAEESLS